MYIKHNLRENESNTRLKVGDIQQEGNALPYIKANNFLNGRKLATLFAHSLHNY